MMDKQEFTRTYKLSDAVPIDPSSRSIKGVEFAEAISEFINDNFQGIAGVDTDVKSNQPVIICAEYIAFYFKKRPHTKRCMVFKIIETKII